MTRRDSTRFRRALDQLVDPVDDGGPFDLTSFSFTPADSGVTFTRPVSAVSGVPGAERAANHGAEEITIQTLSSGAHIYQYRTVKDDGIYRYGRVSIAKFGRSVEVYDQPQRVPLPLRVGVSWTRKEEGNLRRTQVSGAGTVTTPTGQFPHLIVTTSEEETERDPSAPSIVRFINSTGMNTAMVFGPRVTYWNRTKTTTKAAPEGYTTHCAYLAGLPVSFPVPTDWTVMNLHAKSPASHSVTIASDTAAVEALRSGSSEISTGRTMRVGTPDNVLLSVITYGMDEPPKDYLEDLRLGSLNDTEVIHPVSRREVRGRTAYEKGWRGMGGQDRPLVSRYVAFRAADRLFLVHTLHRPDPPGNIDEIVQTVLHHMTIGE